jgi:hypothetical protein
MSSHTKHTHTHTQQQQTQVPTSDGVTVECVEVLGLDSVVEEPSENQQNVLLRENHAVPAACAVSVCVCKV